MHVEVANTTPVCESRHVAYPHCQRHLSRDGAAFWLKPEEFVLELALSCAGNAEICSHFRVVLQDELTSLRLSDEDVFEVQVRTAGADVRILPHCTQFEHSLRLALYLQHYRPHSHRGLVGGELDAEGGVGVRHEDALGG